METKWGLPKRDDGAEMQVPGLSKAEQSQSEE